MKLILMRTGKIPANAEGVAIAGLYADMSTKKSKNIKVSQSALN